MKVLKPVDESTEVRTRYSDSSLLEVIEVLRESYHIYYKDAWAELHTRYSSTIVQATKAKTYTYSSIRLRNLLKTSRM